LFLRGLGFSLGLAVASLGIGMVLGLALAFASLSRFAPLRWFARGYVEVLRNVPILLWTYIVYYVLPFTGITFLNNIASFILALSLYAAAYLTEVFRSGLGTLPARYGEAAKSLGLTSWQRLTLVTLPLVFNITLPALSNNFISLFKDTSIASAIAVPELTFAADYVNTNTFRVIEVWTVVGALYLMVGYALAVGLRALERRVSFGGRAQ
jgi:polar amino acid transport system permease protein